MRWNAKFKIQSQGQDKFIYHAVSGRKRTQIYVKDALKRKKSKRYIVWKQIKHPSFEQPLYMVVCSDKKRKPWYLLTSEVIENKEQAKQLILMYSRRWEIEQTFRRNKADMRSETIQLRDESKRQKLFKLTLLAQNGLLALNEQKELVKVLLYNYCHRRGKRLNKDIKVPFNRMRKARNKLSLTLTAQKKKALAIRHGLLFYSFMGTSNNSG